MSDKESKKLTKKAAKKASGSNDNSFVRGILGVVLLTVFGSIAFSTVVIWGGTDNPAYKIATAPAAIFDVVIAFVAFSKILK